jgi:hypothetical protein
VLTPRADQLILAALDEHISDYKGPMAFSRFLHERKAAWISPEGAVHPLFAPDEHHHDWARANYHIHKVKLGPVGRATNVMNEHGWVRKMDHDQYVIGPESDKEKVFRHVEKAHPDTKRVWISYQRHPGSDAQAVRWFRKQADGSWGRED